MSRIPRKVRRKVRWWGSGGVGGVVGAEGVEVQGGGAHGGRSLVRG